MDPKPVHQHPVDENVVDDNGVDAHPGAPELFLFLASTVHDMKNSISVVSGTLESLLSGPRGKDDPAYVKMAQMLYQTKRMNDNLIQLLALYKQVGKPAYPFDLQPLPVSQLFEQVAAQEAVLLASQGVTLDMACPDGLTWHLDEDLVLGVLGQAINNAIHYTRDRICLTAVTIDGWLELHVEDNGGGFPAALLEAGVEAMSGQTSGVNFSTNSTGLGLYFSSAVATMHKHRARRGNIVLDNGGPLQGGRFILRLP